jgi:hypothetical protein
MLNEEYFLAVAALMLPKHRGEKICFRILNSAIHQHPARRTKAERDLIQGGFAPKTFLAICSHMDLGVVSREATSLKVGSRRAKPQITQIAQRTEKKWDWLWLPCDLPETLMP